MIKFLIKRLIKNSDNVKDPAVRRMYGTCLLYTSDNCSIAANAVLLRQLDENITAVGIPARPVKKDGVPIEKKKKTIISEHNRKMMEQLEELQKEVEVLRKALEEATGTTVPPVIAGGAAGTSEAAESAS